MSDPLHQAEPSGLDLRSAAAWLVDALFERTGRSSEPDLEPAEPRSLRLRRGRRVACVSLVAGCGTTTLTALIAQRSAGAGARVSLVDLDLVAPTLALLAGEATPTLVDILADGARPRRWGSVEVIFGAPHDLESEATGALAELVARLAANAAVIVDAGALSHAASAPLLRACESVLYVTTPRAAHVHAAARATPMLEALGVPVRLAVTRATTEAAMAVAREIGLPLAGAVPEDPFLARDEFRIRGETARAVDRLCAVLAT